MDITFISSNLSQPSNQEDSSNQPIPPQTLSASDSNENLFDLLTPQLECNLCSKQFNSQKNLNKHLKLHSDSREYKCDKCSKLYKRSDHLSRHQIVHRDNPTPFECPHCLNHFSMKYHLKSHIANVHNENPFKFQCAQCSLFFSKKLKLLKHQRKEHKEPRAKVKCYYPYCYKSYLTQNKLQEHIKLFHGQITLEDIEKEEKEQEIQRLKYYKCPYQDCIKVYSTPFNLATHIKSFHLKLNQFACEQCGNGFKHKSSLKRHIEKSKHHSLIDGNEKEEDEKDGDELFEQLMKEFIENNANAGEKEAINALE